jgi:simple sugar transport system permease protein
VTDSQIPVDPIVEKAAQEAGPVKDTRWKDAFREIFTASPWVALGAIVLALLVGGIMIAATGGNPIDAYQRMFFGAIYNPQFANRHGFLGGIRPLMNTLTNATPLIAAGLGLAVSFRAGLFNIGGRGQMIAAATVAAWLGFNLTGVPFPLLLLISLIAGILAGALFAGFVGFLKAKTGAHEVVATIMLNYVAFYFLQWLLAGPMQGDRGTPISNPVQPEAAFPLLFGDWGSTFGWTVSWAFVLSLLAVAFCWWLLNRSSMGFGFRTIGENPRAAKVAGINVDRTMIMAMAVSGALVGLAGTQQALGVLATNGISDAVDAGIGFDAITVALLGGSQPIGVLFAGLLFGAFQAGGRAMQGGGINIAIVSVIQSVIVLFIAAPPLVRAIFRLPQPTAASEAKKAERKAEKLAAKERAKLGASNDGEKVSA